jgi:outer membrane lipoprotein SlyB
MMRTIFFILAVAALAATGCVTAKNPDGTIYVTSNNKPHVGVDSSAAPLQDRLSAAMRSGRTSGS